jgi:tetratricopeptide (TPR) repeat protein
MEQAKKQPQSIFLVWLLSAAITLVEILLLKEVFIDNAASLYILATVHAVIVAVVAGITFIISRVGKDITYSLLLLIFTAFTGPIGSALIFFSIILYVFYSRDSISFADWLKSIFPDEGLTREQKVFEEIEIRGESFVDLTDISNYGDIMAIGTEKQKRRALTNILQYYRPRFGLLLKKALYDPSNAIRVQAATAMAKLQKHYTDPIISKERFIRQTKNPDLIPLAKAYDDYLNSGIITNERKQEITQKAIEVYQAHLKKHPEDKASQFLLGEKFLDEGNFLRAERLLEDCVKLDKINPRIFSWYIQSLYYQKKYTKIRKVLEGYKAKLDTENPNTILALQQLKFWEQGEISMNTN